MKHKSLIIILSFMAAITTSSCIKKFTCKCTTTLSMPGYYPKETVTIQDIKKNTSKKKATQICSNAAKQLQANTDEYYNPSVEVDTECVLTGNDY